ncbi:MAG: hypothetical protein U1E56_01370 [Bauldia sp.]
MRRWLPFLLLAIALVAGYPYASAIIFRAIGTNTVVFAEADGLRRTLISGPDAPRPAWVPNLPGALTVSAAHWLPDPGRAIAGDLDLLTHKDVDDISRFYLDALAKAGFDARDIGYGLMGEKAAAFFGVDGQILAYRAEDDITVAVSIEAASGLILRPRLVKLHWQTWGPAGAEYRARLFAQAK